MKFLFTLNCISLIFVVLPVITCQGEDRIVDATAWPSGIVSACGLTDREIETPLGHRVVVLYGKKTSQLIRFQFSDVIQNTYLFIR
jgi:hypothetical protein